MTNFLLFIVSVVLAIVLYPIGFIFSILSFRLRLTDKMLSLAKAIDQTGNAFCSDLFNFILINKSGYKFGNIDETISSVLGKNEKKETLLYCGKVLVGLLNYIDKEHCKKSIDNSI